MKTIFPDKTESTEAMVIDLGKNATFILLQLIPNQRHR